MAEPQPKFLELVNTVLTKDKKDVSFQEGLSNAKYTVMVEAVWIFPGWDVAMMKQPAKVSLTYKFVESNNKGNEISRVTDFGIYTK